MLLYLNLNLHIKNRNMQYVFPFFVCLRNVDKVFLGTLE